MAASSDKYLLATLSISQCVTLKLNDTNYLSWKLQFEQFLYSQDLLGYVSGEVPCPSQTITTRSEGTVSEASNPDYQKWVRTDRMIMAWLFGSLSEETLKTVYGLKTSQEVWLYLAKQFNRVSATRKLYIQRRIQTTVKGNKTLAQYLLEIKSLCDQLDSIGAPMSEQEKIYGILNGIGREYESIVTVIENSMDSQSVPCYEDVVFKLTNFDDKLQKYESVTEVNPHQAFYSARGGYSGRGRGSNRGGYRGGRNSYSTQGRGFPQQFGQGNDKGSYSGSGNNQRPTCQICGKYGHPALKCYKRFDESYQPEDLPQALAVMKLNDSQDYSVYYYVHFLHIIMYL